MERVRIRWHAVLCTTSCTLHVGLSTAFSSVNCYFSICRSVNELFPLCLNDFFSSRTAQSVILMFTMCLFLDVFSAANCRSTLGTDAAASVELNKLAWSSSCVAKSVFLRRVTAEAPTPTCNDHAHKHTVVSPWAILDRYHLCYSSVRGVSISILTEFLS